MQTGSIRFIISLTLRPLLLPSINLLLEVLNILIKVYFGQSDGLIKRKKWGYQIQLVQRLGNILTLLLCSRFQSRAFTSTVFLLNVSSWHITTSETGASILGLYYGVGTVGCLTIRTKLGLFNKWSSIQIRTGGGGYSSTLYILESVSEDITGVF